MSGDLKSLAELTRAYCEKMGISPEDLPLVEPITYECSICQDIGMLSTGKPYGHPDFGKAYPCPYCAKGQQTQRGMWAKRLREVGLPKDYRELTFETFDALPKNLQTGKLQARLAAEMFALNPDGWISEAQTYSGAGRKYPNKQDTIRNWLVIQGPFGCGKTGLAAAVVNARLGHDCPVLYMRVLDMIENVQRCYRKDYDGLPAEEITDEFRQAPVLVLDDMSVEIESDNRKEIMERVIRARHDNSLPTLITCNATQAQLEASWGRRTITAILGKALWIPIGGEPLRHELPPSTREPF